MVSTWFTTWFTCDDFQTHVGFEIDNYNLYYQCFKIYWSKLTNLSVVVFKTNHQHKPQNVLSVNNPLKLLMKLDKRFKTANKQ